jgi:hypothetical protein
MANTSIEHRPRIDEFLPNHDFSAIYEIRVKAPPSLVYQCLLRSDFNELRMVRLLIPTYVSGYKVRDSLSWRKLRVKSL